MGEKVDQDVRYEAAKLVSIFNQPDAWQEKAALAILAGNWDNVQLLTALARMKAAGREQGLREAADVAQGVLYNVFEESLGDEVKAAIEALLSEKPA